MGWISFAKDTVGVVRLAHDVYAGVGVPQVLSPLAQHVPPLAPPLSQPPLEPPLLPEEQASKVAVAVARSRAMIWSVRSMSSVPFEGRNLSRGPGRVRAQAAGARPVRGRKAAAASRASTGVTTMWYRSSPKNTACASSVVARRATPSSIAGGTSGRPGNRSHGTTDTKTATGQNV